MNLRVCTNCGIIIDKNQFKEGIEGELKPGEWADGYRYDKVFCPVCKDETSLNDIN